MKKYLIFTMILLLFFSHGYSVFAQPQEYTTTQSAPLENSLLQYLQARGEPVFAQNAIGLSAKASNSTVSSVKEREAVSLQEEETVSWIFEVKEDAFYLITVDYCSLVSDSSPLEISCLLDGIVPYTEVYSILLFRKWRDVGAIQQDENGNDLTPEQEEVLEWQQALCKDYSGYSGEPLPLYLTVGTHTLTLACTKGPVALSGVMLSGVTDIPSSDSFLANHNQGPKDFYEKYEAETPLFKSSAALFPTCDRSDPAVSPASPAKIRRNTIGQIGWFQPGEALSYRVEVPADGLYCLTVKYRQNTRPGLSVYRNIYINGEIQHTGLQNVAFPFALRWNNQPEPVQVYLTKGENVITFEAATGQWADILTEADGINNELQSVYRRIIMVTGTSPDPFRDYQLEREIPGLLEKMKICAAGLFSIADRFDSANQKKSSQSETLRSIARQLESFCQKPETIPTRLDSFRTSVTSLSSWLQNGKQQPLEMDYFMLHSPEKELPSPKAGLWTTLVFSAKQFVSSFFEDYTQMSAPVKEGITVWISEGRDQAQIVKDLIADRFTPQTGIPVNISLVQGGFIEATLTGNGPDVSLGVARAQPVNLAARNALLDLSQFDTFSAVTKRFSDDAMRPYQYRNGTYALPNTQRFFMMYYRTDIFEELGMAPPDTWEQMFALISILQRNHMSIGLPYSVISAQNAIDEGLGARDMFSLLLLQNGGNFYNKEVSQTGFDTSEAQTAFRQWTEFYTKYSFELSYDFNTRFRMGEMPIGIASLLFYNTLSSAAPEIRNRWAMVPVPGTVQADGAVNRAIGSTGNGAVVFKNAKNPEACWAFLDWWSSEETQTDYSLRTENLLGPAARNNPANLKAFANLPWKKSELKAIEEQRSFVQEIAEVPGSYFISRSVDNAFRGVLYSGQNPREALEKQNAAINRELLRKRREFEE